MINSNDLILGVSDSHDSGICVFKDNKIIYAINEERISRIKNQSGFPDLSIINFLDKFNINPEQILDSFIHEGIIYLSFVSLKDQCYKFNIYNKN